MSECHVPTLNTAFSESFWVTIHMNASIQVSIRCNNGVTYNVTGPFSCPGESPDVTGSSSNPIFVAR
jgi:hypothetical protein